MTRTARPFVSDLYFAEGPRWHDGRLWISDFFAHRILSIGEGGDVRVEVETGEVQSSGLGWLPDGRLLFVSMLDRSVRRRETDGSIVTHADLSSVATFHTNDMVVAADGTAYVGNFGFDLDAVLASGGPEAALSDPRTAVIAKVTAGGTVSVVATDMKFPNGSVITPDGSTLIIGETLGLRLTAFTIGADGSLTDRRVFADLSAQFCPPDGICLDAEGAIWTSNPLGTTMYRVAEGGAILDQVETSLPSYAVALGGADRRTLYAMVAPSSVAEVASQARNGGIEVVEVDVPGAGRP